MTIASTCPGCETVFFSNSPYCVTCSSERGSEITPPGPIEVTYEWAVQPPNPDPDIWPTWITSSEVEARQALKYHCLPGSTLVRRVKWVAVSDWENVPTNTTEEPA